MKPLDTASRWVCMHSVVSVIVDDTDPRDPAALCDRCAGEGTVVRVVRHSIPPLVLRYCNPCWPAAQQELQERQREERASLPSPPAWSSTSRSWYDARQFLALVAQPPKGCRPLTPAEFATIAAEIRAEADGMDGPVPPDVEDFLARHARG